MTRLRYGKKETTLRAFLKEARLARKLSQTTLAQAYGVPQSFVSKYEQGERYLTFVEVVKLCKIMEADVQDLLCALEAVEEE